MLEHLKEKLINERLARHRISPNLVQRLLQRLYGRLVHRYLQARRIEYAAKLLCATSINVLQVALAIGHQSTGRFGVAFRRTYQMAPS